MAHHLAELIDKAENGVTEAERLKARQSATETILKIWEHRASLPGKTYPLAPYKDILKVLDRLRPDNNPFWYFSRYAATSREQRAAALFDGLSRLIIALLLMKLPPREESTKVDDVAIAALSETEQHVLEAFQQWGEFFAPESGSSGRARKSKGDGGVTSMNLEEAALQLIDTTMTTLSELRSELQGGD
jgi:hypothetical protein